MTDAGVLRAPKAPGDVAAAARERAAAAWALLEFGTVPYGPIVAADALRPFACQIHCNGSVR